jgi:hypothetical protein
MVFLDKDRMMENVQKCNICTNVPLSQTFRPYLETEQVDCDLYLEGAWFVSR